MRRHAIETHTALVQTIRGITDQEWLSTSGDETVGQLIGGLTGGPAGPFRHAFDHLPDLQAYVDSLA